MPSSRPAPTSSTSTSWTTTTCRISRSARSSAKRLRKHGVKAPIDVHLMVKPVDRIIPDFAAAGATYISFHPEATEHVDRTLQLIRERGCKSGLVFNPATPLDWLEHVLDKVDLVLLMSVNPGFGGQQFIESMLPKIAAVRSLIDRAGERFGSRSTAASRSRTSASIAAAGADTFVAGSAIFGAADYAATIAAMRREVANAR